MIKGVADIGLLAVMLKTRLSFDKLESDIKTTMEVKIEIIAKNDIQSTDEFREVKSVADKLLSFLNEPRTIATISATHKTHAKSGQIQDIILPKALELGFTSEKKGLFANYPSNGLRPDYYKKLKNHSGIIMEVERGKTTINNMDILDVWKCHICKDANYLFLIVPQVRQTEKGKNNAIFNVVNKRLQSFFFEENYINIDAVFVFGY